MEIVLFLIIVVIVFAIIALIRSYLKKTSFNGISFVISLVVLVLLLSNFVKAFYVEITTLSHLYPWPDQAVCGDNLSNLSKSLFIYAEDNNGRYPDPNHWCDLLITHASASPKQFVCKSSDAIKGESSYALNINAGRNTDPGDLVLLFEAKFDPNGASRDFPYGSRDFAIAIGSTKKDKVYKDRWNLAGGPELLTTEYHNFSGCKITYIDGSTSFGQTQDLHKLRWAVDQNGPLPEDFFKFEKPTMKPKPFLSTIDPEVIAFVVIAVITTLIGIGICFYKKRKTKPTKQ